MHLELRIGIPLLLVWCGDNKGYIFAILGKMIGDVLVLLLVAEAIAISEDLKTATDDNIDKILIESDSQL